MINPKTMLLCAHADFRKWPVNSRICILGAVIVCFLGWNLSGLVQLSAAAGVPLTPWVFTSLISSPVMVVVYSCFTMLLFCDAPFTDSQAPFLMIRCGRRNWIAGQLLYIVAASFVYTVFNAVVSVLVLSTNVRFSSDWGILYRTLAQDPGFAKEYGVSLTIFINPQIIKMFSPVQATLISCGFFWLAAAFIGTLIFCFNVLFEKMSGLIAAGVFIALSYFCIYLGPLTLRGYRIRWLSPLNWCGIDFLNWDGNSDWPKPAYAVTVLLIAILLMGAVSIAAFCKKDLNIRERRN